MIRSDTNIVLNDILDELREIHKLLQWVQLDTLAERKRAKDSAESQKAELEAWADTVVAKGKQAALEAQRQAYDEHIALYHSKGNVGNA